MGRPLDIPIIEKENNDYVLNSNYLLIKGRSAYLKYMTAVILYEKGQIIKLS